jgi:flagellar basal-body rod protein FlgB
MNGNSVVLEEQVSELAATRARYDAAIGLYQKSLGLIRMAIKAPGR